MPDKAEIKSKWPPYYQDAQVTLLEGSTEVVLSYLEDESVQTVVTSPPYWGLRDYGMTAQLGLEAMPEIYVANMVEVFQEVRRVLRKDGTLWLNLGDSYTSIGRGGRKESPGVGAKQEMRSVARDVVWAPRDEGDPDAHFRWSLPGGQKPKDLIGIPWMLAFALRADGWYLRSDIIWAKPNPMPESVTDRPTKAHEYLFLLAKSERYYYDAAAIRTPFSGETKALSFDTMEFARRDGYKAGRKIKMPDGWDTGPGGHGTFHRKGREKGKQREIAASSPGPSSRRLDGLNDRWDSAEASGELPDGANKRTVWTVPTQAYPEAHFATFPPDLIKPCILAGCPEGGVVLDPFVGSGTTALVAKELGRKAIGIDLNPAYLEMARKRLHQETLWGLPA